MRNFVQLCLEGYYDETVFHRLIKGYILQGGDATGTGTGGESVFGKPFKDEFHSRLRFTHRYPLYMLPVVSCNQATSMLNPSSVELL